MWKKRERKTEKTRNKRKEPVVVVHNPSTGGLRLEDQQF